ncbi:MAG: hypothetical protein PHJ00_01540 [Candidatus Omnitrophica bacterium]|jgi:Flp pilus assembly pilin Flp|nr:hypothetical protein [Candidatus Omnitrophota bacterium]
MKTRGQSIIEYTVLIAVIAAAFIAMHQYIYRSMNARLKQVQDEVYESPAPGVEAPTTPQ